MVISFCAVALGGLALTPNVSFGQAAPESPNTDAERAAMLEQERNSAAVANVDIQNKKDYDEGYNQGYMRAREEEQRRLDEQAYNQNSSCCGGGGGQQQGSQ